MNGLFGEQVGMKNEEESYIDSTNFTVFNTLIFILLYTGM